VDNRDSERLILAELQRGWSTHNDAQDDIGNEDHAGDVHERASVERVCLHGTNGADTATVSFGQPRS